MTHPALRLAVAIADTLDHPGTLDDLPAPGPTQSLATGIPGIALLHIELAAADLRPWTTAHTWLCAATGGDITSGPDSHLFYGGPAIAHAVASAAAVRPGSYQRALDHLDATVTADALRRAGAAHARIDAGRPATLAEFDTIRGLTGIGAYLLRRDPDCAALRAVLEYLVRLAEPVDTNEGPLPGWWVQTGPSGQPDMRYPGGHGNLGLAHGITGPMALLGYAALAGITVDGHLHTLTSLLAWFDQWRTYTEAGRPAWPYWITPVELRAGRADRLRPQRPSWCYGTPGLARAIQVAALAAGDLRRAHAAEAALLATVADPAQVAQLGGLSLCHGTAGLAFLAAVVAADASPSAAQRLREHVAPLLDTIQPADAVPSARARSLLRGNGGPGLLDGAAGVGLACLAAAGPRPSSGWDTCLLATVAPAEGAHPR